MAFLGILILLAILFRREMRGLVTLIGFVLLVMIIWFGVNFARYEQAHPGPTTTMEEQR